MIINHLIGTGVPTQQAAAITGGRGENTYTAAGTTQGTATLLGGGVGYVSIVSASGKGVQLPACDPNSSVFVYNGGANAMFVYGQTGEAIGAGSANAGFNIPTKKGCEFVKCTATVWGQNLS